MPRPKMKKNKPSLMTEESSIWEFIYEMVVQKERFDEVGLELFQRFLKYNELPFTAQEVLDYYTETMKPSLYKSDLDVEKILELYKNLEIEVSPHVEQILEMRCGAGIRIDADRYLVHYTIFAAPKNKRRQTEDVPVKKSREQREEEQDEADESEEPIRKKLKPWPSPLKNKPARSVPGISSKQQSPVIEREAFLEKVSKKMQPPRDKNLQPLPWEVPEHVDKAIWKYLRNNSDSVTARNIISGEFWVEFFNNRELPFKTVGVLTRHFRATLVPKLWEQKMDSAVKMKLLTDLRVPVSRQQRRRLLEEEGIDVTVTEGDLIATWEGPDDEGNYEEEEVDSVTPKRELLSPPQETPKMKINTWIPRAPRTVNSLVDDFANFSCIPSGRNSSSSRTDSAVPSRSQSVIANGRESDDLTALQKKQDKRTPFSREDDLLAWRYIVAQMYDQQAQRITNPNLVQPKGRTFWEDFIRKTTTKKSASNWCSHFRKKMCLTLHEVSLTREVKLALYVHLDIFVSEEVLAILEQKCNVKINLVKNRVHSWRVLGKADSREQTADTEPLVNDDEETDGESSATALQAAFETGTSPKEAAPAEEHPGTSVMPNNDQRKRKSEEEDQQSLKRRSLKLADISADEIEIIEEPISVKKSPPSIDKDSSEIAKKRSIVPPPQKKKVIDLSPSPTPPPRRARMEHPREMTGSEDNTDWSRVEMLEDQYSAGGKDELIPNPLDVKAVDGFFMSTNDLLAAIKAVLAESADEGLEMMNDAVPTAFARKPGDQKCNRENVARHSFSTPIQKIRGLFRHTLGARQKEMVEKATGFCENQAVFRKRVSAMTDVLSTRLDKMKPPVVPWDSDED